jgi:hypothetical protein
MQRRPRTKAMKKHRIAKKAERKLRKKHARFELMGGRVK